MIVTQTQMSSRCCSCCCSGCRGWTHSCVECSADLEEEVWAPGETTPGRGNGGTWQPTILDTPCPPPAKLETTDSYEFKQLTCGQGKVRAGNASFSVLHLTDLSQNSLSNPKTKVIFHSKSRNWAWRSIYRNIYLNKQARVFFKACLFRLCCEQCACY